MNQDDLIDRYNALVDARESFIQALSVFTTEQLHSPPAQGWSPVQVVEHIMSSERGTLGYMKKKTSSGWESLELAGPAHEETARMLVARLESDMRLEAPAVLPQPQGLLRMDELLATWEEERNALQQFVFDLDEEFYPRLVFRQPVAGPLTLHHTLDFLRVHIVHHIPQLARIRAQWPA